MNGIALTWKRTAENSITPIGPGVYFVPVKGASLETRAAMLSRLLPGEVVVARRTAAWLWGLDVLPPGVREADWPVDLVDPRSSGPQARIPAEHTVERADVRLTSPPRTALDCARWLPRYEAVAGLDQFLRRGVRVAELRKMARTLPGYRGNTRLGEILRLGDHGSASPGESWTKVAVVDAGFPRPACQVPVMGPYDRMLYVDLGYERFRVGLEYDGERHHTGSEARGRDRRRRKWLAQEQNWEVIPVTRDFLSRPAPYLEALLTALLHRGWTPDDTTLDRIGRRLRTLTRHRR
ncbi:hypothetical protein BJF79_11915 [Actinomadura sp. CNU-125]|uniref:hypothetical protein n=1 Tax=Actinomadura sp. CNU-125 TaxID=1904961 RepID=UPI00096367C5|nr:hypothetical protein [Actinomadura sp. CNU-125]OLT26931.1 hypothetical protein BJF79_11915 [Actinomadura sp. CNU-125]